MDKHAKYSSAGGPPADKTAAPAAPANGTAAGLAAGTSMDKAAAHAHGKPAPPASHARHGKPSAHAPQSLSPLSPLSPLSLEQELEQLSRLLHGVQAPLGTQDQEVLLALARHMQSLVDTRTCALHSEAFVCQLETEMHRVRRGRSELALVCFSLHGQDEIISQHGPDAVHQACQALVCSLKEYVLPCDCIGYIPSGHYALILPGVGGFKAQVYVEKILHACGAQGLRTPQGAFIPHFMAGIACASGTNARVETLLEEALSALDNAANSPHFCAVYRNTGSTGLYQTLVHSKEKRFLFSGGQ